MTKGLFVAGTMVLAGVGSAAQAQTTITTTVSSVSCKLDPADTAPVTPSVAAGITAGNKFSQAYSNFQPLAPPDVLDDAKKIQKQNNKG